ncbi:hypothetical protein ACWKT3_20895 [Streptomyces violaceus]
MSSQFSSQSWSMVSSFFRGVRSFPADPLPARVHGSDSLGEQRKEAAYGRQDDVIVRLTQIYGEKKKSAPSVAGARRELGQLTVTEYAKQLQPRQRRVAEHSRGWHVDSSINVRIIPDLEWGANSITSIVVERFLDELDADGVGDGNQVNVFRTRTSSVPQWAAALNW